MTQPSRGFGPKTISVGADVITIAEGDNIIVLSKLEARAMRDRLTKALDEPDYHEIAHDVARDTLYHIDTMYPAMWSGVPRSARISVRNTIISTIMKYFKQG